MKSKKSYRVSGRFKEILEVLEKARKSRKNFLWRSQSRQPIPIHIHMIHPEANTVMVSLQERGSAFFRVDDELYLKLEARDAAFKTRVQSLQDQMITLSFPEEMVLSEYRAETRHQFSLADEKTVQIKRIRNYVSSQSERYAELPVVDISQTGLALGLTQLQANKLQVKDRILLEEIGHFKLQNPIIGEVVFKVPYATGAKIGIHLEKKISKVVFDRFIVREKFFGKSSERIVGNILFRVKVKEHIEAMQKALNAKKSMKKVFALIDNRYAEHMYLKQHTQLLCEVMCGLGLALGWVAEENMDRMIYVALLHDARYFSLPKLAQIKTKKEFEKVKKTLSRDEQLIFLEGPQFAAELARTDIDSYPDAAKILIQQKELPDGSGFPFGIGVAQLLPLSCLFIASHFFVDYILENQDWSVNDFLKSHQKYLKGQYFQKIVQAMKGQ